MDLSGFPNERAVPTRTCPNSSATRAILPGPDQRQGVSEVMKENSTMKLNDDGRSSGAVHLTGISRIPQSLSFLRAVETVVGKIGLFVHANLRPPQVRPPAASCRDNVRGALGRGSHSEPSPSARFPRGRCAFFSGWPARNRAAAGTCPRAASFRLVRASTGAAVALVALAALAFPLPAAAQSTTTFVSNTGQPFYRESFIEWDRAQRFTTGSHENGYDLSGVRLMFGRGFFFFRSPCA